MILTIDMSNKAVVVTKNPEPKLDSGGNPRLDKTTGHPMWATEVVVTDTSGGEIIRITTADPHPPEVDAGDQVRLSNLIAHPWSSSGRTGVAYRADTIKAVPKVRYQP